MNEGSRGRGGGGKERGLWIMNRGGILTSNLYRFLVVLVLRRMDRKLKKCKGKETKSKGEEEGRSC